MLCVLVQQGSQLGFAEQNLPAMPAGQLVREVIYNELHDHEAHGYWRYWIKKQSPNQTVLEDQVETPMGPVTRVTLRNGLALDAVPEQQEHDKLERLLTSRDEQAHHLRQYEEDEQRMGRILEPLPDAFLYDYDGTEDSCVCMRFRPNPAYTAQSIEARIFHGMGGSICVDTRSKRLVSLQGRIQQNVDFALGFLGRLYQGGWFRLKRVQVSATDWKTESLEVHLTVRPVLVKSFARETSEQRGGFEPVPSALTLAQGMGLLEQTEAKAEPQLRSPGSRAT